MYIFVRIEERSAIIISLFLCLIAFFDSVSLKVMDLSGDNYFDTTNNTGAFKLC